MPRPFSSPRAFALALACGVALTCSKDSPTVPREPPVPAAIAIAAGDGQSAAVGTELPAAIAVSVTDEAGRPLPGQTVAFHVVSGGGSLSQGSAVTNAAGVAAVRWTLGTSTAAADSQVVEASVARGRLSPLVARARATALPGALAALTRVSGDSQTAPVGQPLPAPLVLKGVDRYGNPVPGAAVTWAARAGGGALAPAAPTTDAGGLASATWTLGLRADSTQVAAASAGGVTTTFDATPTLPDDLDITKLSGDAQTGTAGGTLPESLAVRVRLPDGRPLQGVSVQWAAAPGHGTAAPASTRTDAQGAARASWTLGPALGEQRATALVARRTSLAFTATAVPGAAAGIAKVGGDNQTATVAQPLPSPLAVKVVDQLGNAVSGVTVTWTVTAGGGSVAPATSQTDAQGVAQTRWTLGPTAGPQAADASVSGLAPVTFTATGRPDVAVALVKARGDQQTAPVGRPEPDSLVVRAVDRYENGVPGVTVTWLVTNGSALVHPTWTVTDARGETRTRATAPVAVSVYDPASTVTVSAYGLAPVTFTEEATPAAGDLAVQLVPVVTGLAQPIYLTAPRDDPRLFVVERPGRIRIVKNGQLLAQPFLDISSDVGTEVERGLLSIAFHPQYASNGFVYVSYTDRYAGDLRIERFSVSAANPDSADLASRKRIITVPHPNAANHNGGLIAFGPDGMLYWGTGDGGQGGDPPNNAQNLGTLLGKLVRIDVDHGDPYAIPPDNPYAGGQGGARPEIWALGLRNPWRWAFDDATGLLYIADVGQNLYEEVDVVDARQAGLNYGWRRMEASACYPSGAQCSPAGLVLPALEYNHSQGCSVIGGYVYRGSLIPELVGHFVYSDYCRISLRSFRYVNGEVADHRQIHPGNNIGNVLSLGRDSAGEIYVLSEIGTVFRMQR